MSIRAPLTCTKENASMIIAPTQILKAAALFADAKEIRPSCQRVYVSRIGGVLRIIATDGKTALYWSCSQEGTDEDYQLLPAYAAKAGGDVVQITPERVGDTLCRTKEHAFGWDSPRMIESIHRLFSGSWSHGMSGGIDPKFLARTAKAFELAGKGQKYHHAVVAYRIASKPNGPTLFATPKECIGGRLTVLVMPMCSDGAGSIPVCALPAIDGVELV
jgi:hypothetical protein